ncbi:hypothetical protein DESUT3_22150 [Desulfuromonas versatilis]|uniref:Flagellin N-methylase n=1 Tax=Desulfuromonas versatilis TaxID=2802975 RepID=A0ABM8HT64_9BACT|nr:hypothetical protein [Desulfuromonas versatilis]BCR05146.1 hypothetical protein DESUT3_22150 [Desulfuromonas versatilis]
MSIDKDKEWEGKCLRCGRCCYEKLEYQGQVYYTDVPCEKLDRRSGLCTVYPQREKLRPGCVKITPEIARRGILPEDCPYVEGIIDYPAPGAWDEKQRRSRTRRG